MIDKTSGCYCDLPPLLLKQTSYSFAFFSEYSLPFSPLDLAGSWASLLTLWLSQGLDGNRINTLSSATPFLFPKRYPSYSKSSSPSEVHVLLTVSPTSWLAPPVLILPHTETRVLFYKLNSDHMSLLLRTLLWRPVILGTKPKACLHVWPYIISLTPTGYIVKLALLLFLQTMALALTPGPLYLLFTLP